jgi:hypothetical protein
MNCLIAHKYKYLRVEVENFRIFNKFMHLVYIHNIFNLSILIYNYSLLSLVKSISSSTFVHFPLKSK